MLMSHDGGFGVCIPIDQSIDRMIWTDGQQYPGSSKRASLLSPPWRERPRRTTMAHGLQGTSSHWPTPALAYAKESEAQDGVRGPLFFSPPLVFFRYPERRLAAIKIHLGCGAWACPPHEANTPPGPCRRASCVLDRGTRSQPKGKKECVGCGPMGFGADDGAYLRRQTKTTDSGHSVPSPIERGMDRLTRVRKLFGTHTTDISTLDSSLHRQGGRHPASPAASVAQPRAVGCFSGLRGREQRARAPSVPPTTPFDVRPPQEVGLSASKHPNTRQPRSKGCGGRRGRSCRWRRQRR